jgi:hypothetical protein
MTASPELLPLGSAVKTDDGVFVIIARGFQKQEDGFLAGYKGVPHPQGAAAGVRQVVIRHTQITKVVRRGHEDDTDLAFAKEQLANAKTPPKTTPAPDAEPDRTVDLAAPAAAPTASSTADSRDADPSEITVTNARDPFSELRRKGKMA